MKISDILSKSIMPPLYEKGTSNMWNDDYISKQLLNIHLNPEIDLASRKQESIHATADWILQSQPKNRKLKILDLGCGPGLYAEFFAQRGHDVTGVDLSVNSINYAKKEAQKKDMNISYINANYLELAMPAHSFDLITLIFTDFGVLSPKEREVLLSFVHHTLNKGGLFIFDVLRDNNMAVKVSPKTWEASTGGFWSPLPYLALSESFLYQDDKIILYQHFIIEEEQTKVYRFWTHYFSPNDIENILSKHGFSGINSYDNILPEGDQWNGDNVIFCKAIKE